MNAFRLDAAEAERRRAKVRDLVATVPDFPKPGILFRDITPVLHSADRLVAALSLHLHHIADVAQAVEAVVGIESRGFLFGMAVAGRIGAGFVPVRKPGKLPRETIEHSYALEYGNDTLQIHADAIRPGDKVLVIDDLLATGGTAAATCKLVRQLGGEVVVCMFLVELVGLGGRERLGDQRVEAILSF